MVISPVSEAENIEFIGERVIASYLSESIVAVREACRTTIIATRMIITMTRR